MAHRHGLLRHSQLGRSVMRPGVPPRLASLLQDMHEALERKVEAANYDLAPRLLDERRTQSHPPSRGTGPHTCRTPLTSASWRSTWVSWWSAPTAWSIAHAW